MPRYHIELRTQDRLWDTLDVVRADTNEARIEIAQFVGELLKDHADQIWVDEEWRVDVTDETGRCCQSNCTGRFEAELDPRLSGDLMLDFGQTPPILELSRRRELD